MKNHGIKWVFIIFFSALSGCASLTGVDPSNLEETKKKNHLIISHEFKWEEKFSLAQLTHYMTLKSGKYEAYLDDSQGTYYEGAGPCLEWNVAPSAGGVAPTINNYRCGLYMPNNDKNRILVYYYIDAEASKKIMDQTNPGVLIRALDKAEWNNLKHLMYQPDALELKSHLEISH